MSCAPSNSAGAALVAVALLAGCVSQGPVWRYHRTFDSGALHSSVTQWMKVGAEPDAERVVVTMAAVPGPVRTCEFETWDRLERSWMTDLDGDDEPEMILVARAAGSGSYGSLWVATLMDGRVEMRVLPALSPESGQGYMGHDVFQVERGGAIVRTFPIYVKRDANVRPSGGLRRITYAFKGKQLVMWESKDSLRPKTAR